MSKQLPVHLEYLPPERLGQATVAFPHASSLSVYKTQGLLSRFPFNSDLSDFHNLNRLELRLEVYSPTFYSGIHFVLPSQLTQLSLFLFGFYYELNILASIKHLTELTKLCLSNTKGQRWMLKPLTELEKYVNFRSIPYFLWTLTAGVSFLP